MFDPVKIKKRLIDSFRDERDQIILSTNEFFKKIELGTEFYVIKEYYLFPSGMIKCNADTEPYYDKYKVPKIEISFGRQLIEEDIVNVEDLLKNIQVIVLNKDLAYRIYKFYKKKFNQTPTWRKEYETLYKKVEQREMAIQKFDDRVNYRLYLEDFLYGEDENSSLLTS